MTKNDLIEKLKDFEGEDEIVFKYFEDYHGMIYVRDENSVEILNKGDDTLCPTACVISIFGD